MNTTQTDKKNFEIGLVLAGAVSAGAYTAGVMDFLLEALEEWNKAKEEGKKIPMHNVKIKVITGASAGGMTAAMAAVEVRKRSMEKRQAVFLF
jgi:predicted acylesterase/phospholipase RssA